MLGAAKACSVAPTVQSATMSPEIYKIRGKKIGRIRNRIEIAERIGGIDGGTKGGRKG